MGLSAVLDLVGFGMVWHLTYNAAPGQTSIVMHLNAPAPVCHVAVERGAWCGAHAALPSSLGYTPDNILATSNGKLCFKSAFLCSWLLYYPLLIRERKARIG